MSRRRRSREIALQILYAMELSETPPEDAIELYYKLFDDEEDMDFDIPMDVRPFAEDLVQGVELHQAEIDELITSSSQHWRLYRMPVVDRNILRIALYEMLYRPDIPLKVSINEAVELGKTFGSQDSGAFINGILDHLLPILQEKNRNPAPKEQESS
ncbi:MAG: transcription antitermination factor NusB [Deltaproteobacteria bacterium]|nr:transcription antitermination factor NusB [Deltaproteobacteria bacterium]